MVRVDMVLCAGVRVAYPGLLGRRGRSVGGAARASELRGAAEARLRHWFTVCRAASLAPAIATTGARRVEPRRHAGRHDAHKHIKRSDKRPGP